MKSTLKQLCGFLFAASLLVGSFSISADEGCCSQKLIRKRDVVGSYQFSGFSNTVVPTSPLLPQSQAVVGRATFTENGTGIVEFINGVANVNGILTSTPRFALPFTYALGPVNGEGTLTLPNFPLPGDLVTYTLSFKSRKGKVVGFSQLTTTTTLTDGLWTLIQAERFN